MSAWQLWVVTSIYAYTGLKMLFVNHDVPWAIVWVSYAMANAGLIFSMGK